MKCLHQLLSKHKREYWECFLIILIGSANSVSLRQLARTGEIVESPEVAGQPTVPEDSNKTQLPDVETNTCADDAVPETMVETEQPDAATASDENVHRQPASPAPATAGVPDQPYTDTGGRFIRTRPYNLRSCQK